MRQPALRHTTDGLPLTDRRIRHGLRVNVVAGALGMIFVAMALGVPLTMMLEELGASGVQIGLVVTVQQLAMIIQIPAAIYAENLPSRKTYWAPLALLHRIVWVVPAILPFLLPTRPDLVVPLIISIVALSSMLAHGSAASWYSWMADLVPANTSGRFWGVRQSFTMAAYLGGMALSGWLLDAIPTPSAGGSYTGFMIVFVISALLGAADIIVHLRVPEPTPFRIMHKESIRARLVAPLQDRSFRFLTLAMGVWYFSLALVGSFGMVYLKRDYGVTYTELAALGIAASIGTIVAGVPLGYLIDRLGARTLGCILMVAAPLCGSIWFFVTPAPARLAFSIPLLGDVTVAQPVLICTLMNLLAGGLYSGVGLCQLSLSSALAPQKGKTVAMAVHWSSVGLMASAGPLVGGKIMDVLAEHPINITLPFGAPFGFYHLLVIIHALCCCLFGLPMLLMVRTKQQDLPVRTALSRLWVGNPLRAIVSVYNILEFNRPMSSARAAKAARKLGEGKTAVAVKDLIGRLEDPSFDVREEAVLALGRIGSPEAIDALIWQLQSPDSDLSPQVARALRESPHPAAVDVLIDKLDQADAETQRESARTLAAIGDPKAAPRLLDLVKHSEDSSVLSASSSALAQLGQLAAIYEIIPHMKRTRNPVLKRSMAVAVGDLLGAPGEFYRIMAGETQAPGSQIEKMMKALRKALKRAFPARLELLASIGRLSNQLEAAYDEQDWSRCQDVLLRMAMLLATVIHQIEWQDDTSAMIEDLIWRDEQIAIGLWFLDIISDDPNSTPSSYSIDLTDILIGTYYVSSLRSKLPKTTRESEEQQTGQDESE